MKRYIQNIISSFINKVIVHYKHQKAKERIVRYRKGRRTIYIIRIDFPMAGLFAIAKSVLCHIEYALDKGWIPVVDLCNSVNQFKKNDGKNPWELFFAQPMTTGLDDISSEDNIIISCRDQSPNPNYRLTVDALLPENDNELSKHSTYYNKYIRLSDNARKYLNGKVGEIIAQRRNILGVLCRGTDYLEKKPVYHPIQPEPKDVILKIHEMQKNMTIDYVYLATEDMRILQLFQEEFGDRLLFIGQKRLACTKDSCISDVKMDLEEKIKMNLDYLVSMHILSKCDYLIGGRTSGTIAACLMNNKYKYKYLWNLGLYQPY